MEVEAVPAMLKITGRASNRVLVGAPLCQDTFSFETSGKRYLITNQPGRNPDYIDLNMQFTIKLLKTAGVLRLIPTFLGR